MASSHNLAAVEPWIFRSSFPDSWISQSFARDNEILTKALLETVSPAIPLVANESPAPAIARFGSYSGADLTANVMNPKRMNSIPVKKKSRKSKRAATTFIMADPENFRQMVQEVTGGGQGMPSFAAPLLKPEPQRLFNLMQGYLPTLDTSAFLLDEKHQPPAMDVSPPSLMNHSPAVNFDSFSCFPTLESWKVL